MEASPDGQLLAVGNCGRSIEVWDVQARRRLHRFAIKRECVVSAAFSPDGRLLATTEVGCCAGDGGVQIWDLRRGTLEREFAKGLDIGRVVFGENGRWVAGVDSHGKTTVFEWPSGRQLRTFMAIEYATAPEGTGLSSPDGKYVVFHAFRELGIWDIASGKRIAEDNATALQFLDDGRFAYVVDDRLKIATLPNGPVEDRPLQRPKQVWYGDVGFTEAPEWQRIRPNGRTVAGTFESRTVLWDTRAARLRNLRSSPALAEAERLQWTRSGIVAWANQSLSSAGAWRDTSGQPLREAEARALFEDAYRLENETEEFEEAMRVDHLASSPDGRWIAAALGLGRLNTLTVWPVANRGDLVTLDTDGVTYLNRPLVFSSDSRWIASFIKGKTLTLWSTGSWKVERNWTLPDYGRALAFAPQGSRLAIAADGEAAIWDAATGRKLVTLTGPGTLRAQQVAWSPNGDRVVTASDDGVLRFWNASSGQLIASLYAIAGTRDWLLVTPDGRFDGSDGALGKVVAWRKGDRVALDNAFTDRKRVRGLWQQVLSGR